MYNFSVKYSSKHCGKILKLPDPVDKVARLQAAIDENGLGEIFKIQNRRFDKKSGNVIIEITMISESNRESDELLEILQIKPFSADKDTVTLFGSEARLISADDGIISFEMTIEHPQKRWLGSGKKSGSNPPSDDKNRRR